MEIEITYLPIKNKHDKIPIFGHIFVTKNSGKFKIIYRDKEYELKENFEDIDEEKYLSIDYIKLKLKVVGKIIDLSYFFHECKSLLSFKIIPQLNNNNKSSDFNYESNEPDSSQLFEDPKFLNTSAHNNNMIKEMDNLKIPPPSVSTIKKNNITYNTTYNSTVSELFPNNYRIPALVNSNVTNIDSIFYGCSSLIYLPDISNWDTSNVTQMGSLFYNCHSLISIPDISKWNTSKVNTMECMFYNCNSLISLPDISKWDTSNVTDMGSMFCGCLSLASMPDISIWKTPKVNKIYYMFLGCNSLISIPDISNWNVSNANYINSMFSECLSLVLTPNISKWDIKKKNILKGMFGGSFNCLNNLP